MPSIDIEDHHRFINGVACCVEGNLPTGSLEADFAQGLSDIVRCYLLAIAGLQRTVSSQQERQCCIIGEDDIVGGAGEPIWRAPMLAVGIKGCWILGEEHMLLSVQPQ